MNVVFFFFQAEDVIRDFHVTGVQTCALPISTCTTCRAGKPTGGQPSCWSGSEEHTSELQSRENLVCRLLLEKKKKKPKSHNKFTKKKAKIKKDKQRTNS